MDWRIGHIRDNAQNDKGNYKCIDSAKLCMPKGVQFYKSRSGMNLSLWSMQFVCGNQLAYNSIIHLKQGWSYFHVLALGIKQFDKMIQLLYPSGLVFSARRLEMDYIVEFWGEKCLQEEGMTQT